MGVRRANEYNYSKLFDWHRTLIGQPTAKQKWSSEFLCFEYPELIQQLQRDYSGPGGDKYKDIVQEEEKEWNWNNSETIEWINRKIKMDPSGKLQ